MATGPAQSRTRTQIRVLPELVQNQIAAGEVIERPASVVKELVENALDAGAREIRVDLELGGMKLVRVSDDGCGMGSEDLALCVEPHATSKLYELADLEHIASLGFRGEALASIASVARLALYSRPREPAESRGAELSIEGGTRTSPREAGGPSGTRVEVRDLFYNTPARRAFQKSTATELGRCLDLLQRLALAHEGVGFAVTHDGRRVYDVEAGMDLSERVRRTFGAELASSLIQVEAAERGLRLSGFLAPPRLSRRDSTRQMWFLNGRALKDRLLARLLKEAYRGYDDSGRQPVCFLRLSLDPAQVDVNVHPTKSEVRFREERRVFGFGLAALRAALASADLATPGSSLIDRVQRREGTAATFGAPGHRDGASPGSLPSYPATGSEPRELLPFRAPAAERAALVRESAPHFDPAPRGGHALPAADLDEREEGLSFNLPADQAAGEAGYLQIARCFIVRALPDGFELIDQHALHERVTYEGLKRDLASGAIETQRWLMPELVEVSRAELALLAAHFEALHKVGIELEPFGETTVAVHGLPARLARPRPALIVRDLAAFLEEKGRAPVPAELLEAALQRAACRSSVMAGDALSTAEMRALIEQGRALESDQTCVHGRPTRVRFSLSDLEKAFHRR